MDADGDRTTAALLDGREAHIWYVQPNELADPALLAAYAGLLSPAERERNARFWFERDRHSDLITRALVRTTLSRYHPSVAPRDWHFRAGSHGRPEIAGPASGPDLRFSLSHTNGLIACLVAAGRDVGVDVEDMTRSGLDHLNLAARFFSPDEVHALLALPEHMQVGRFFAVWTLKEAYVKARGLGLSLPLDRFTLDIDREAAGGGRRVGIRFGEGIQDDPRDWQMELHAPSPRHRLGLAIRRGDGPDLPVHLSPIVPLVGG
jgi:4'-phosphopantetheinyl transferase